MPTRWQAKLTSLGHDGQHHRLHATITEGPLAGAAGPWPIAATEESIRYVVTGSTRGLLVPGSTVQLGFTRIGEHERTSWMLVELWDRDLTRVVETRPISWTDRDLAAALALINRRRVGVQPELKLRPGGGWSSRSNPGEVWTAEDVVREAQRLEPGWSPRGR